MLTTKHWASTCFPFTEFTIHHMPFNICYKWVYIGVFWRPIVSSVWAYNAAVKPLPNNLLLISAMFYIGLLFQKTMFCINTPLPCNYALAAVPYHNLIRRSYIIQFQPRQSGLKTERSWGLKVQEKESYSKGFRVSSSNLFLHLFIRSFRPFL